VIRLAPRGARLGLFGFVGTLGAVLQVALFSGFAEGLGLPEILGMPIAVELTVLHNFFWHERLTWRDRGIGAFRDRAVRLWRFHVANGLTSIAGNMVLGFVLTHTFQLHGAWVAWIAIAVCAPFNFWAADRWVFGEGRGKCLPLPDRLGTDIL
jgi:dolichol-phosphate mannosyltransferase